MLRHFPLLLFGAALAWAAEPSLELVSQRPAPVLTTRHPDARGNKYGFEGGRVVKVGSAYHLFTSEMCGDPIWVKMRLAHWRSPDGQSWQRVSTLFESSGEFRGQDPRASLWSPLPVWDDSDERWNLFYVAYRSEPGDGKAFTTNEKGEIWRAVSQTKGREGIGGPYRDIGVVMQPGPDSQKWEGLQGTDSFFPYKVGRTWYALYGSAQSEKMPIEHWLVGLASAPAIDGPWKRSAGNPLPIEKVFIENPIAEPLPGGGFLCVYDSNANDAIGYAYSADGVHWNPGHSLVVQPQANRWSHDVRTPLGLVDEGGGEYSIFYTGFEAAPNWPELLAGRGGRARSAVGSVRVRLVRGTGPHSGTATISGRIVDAATGQPVPATVSIRTSGGEIIADHPSYKGGFRCAGSFEKQVPPGETEITVVRGFDYLPVSRRVTVRDGDHREETFKLVRRSPLRSEGWYASDHHAHMIHGERNALVDFPYVALAGRAEGLDFLSVAQAWNLKDPTPENLERAARAVSTPDFTLTWNLEAPKNYYRGDAGKCLGHGWTVAMRGRTSDGRDAVAELLEINAHDFESGKPPSANFESHAVIHSLGGFVSYTHPVRWWTGKWGGQGIYPLEENKFISNMATELPFDTVAGPTYDSIDILMPPHEKAANAAALKLWFLLLNRGYHIPATASSDATFDNPGRGIPGIVRVYTHIQGEPNLAKVAAVLKAGHSFVTSGPLLTLEVDGSGSGDVLPVSPVARKAAIRAWADGLTRVELLRNGAIVRTFDIPPGSNEFRTEFEVTGNERAWYIARCYGADESQVAITNPIWFEPGGWAPPKPAAARVTIAVRESRTGQPLDGTVEVVRMVGKEPVVESRTKIRNGKLTLDAPATSRIRVQVPGYKPAMQSIFLDYAPLREMATTMRPEQLTEWATFEKVRDLLQNVTLEFRVPPQ